MPDVLGFWIDPNLALAIGGVLIVIGLAFAFFGRGIWSALMAVIGAALGAILGYLFGLSFGSGQSILAIVLALVGGLIGGYLFGKIVKIALALVMGVLAAALIFVAFGTPGPAIGADARTISAVIAFFVVFAISYYFIDELIAIITSIIGGLLVALGAYVVLGRGYGLVAGIIAVLVFVLGATWQTIKLRRQNAIKKAMAAPQGAYAYPPQQQAPPPPPPPPQ